MPDIKQPVQWAVLQPVDYGLGNVRGSFTPPLPPSYDTLLVWAEGSTTFNDPRYERVDSAPNLGTFNLEMSAANCVLMNTTTDKITMAGHGSISSFQGTATPVYDGTDLTASVAGLLYNITFSDGAHFPLSEGGGTAVRSPDGLHTGAIVTTDLPVFWGSAQGFYFFNAIEGWWDAETPDGIHYPADPGIGTFHAGELWNGSEQNHHFKADEVVGTFNGVADRIDTTIVQPSGEDSYYSTLCTPGLTTNRALMAVGSQPVDGFAIKIYNSSRLLVFLSNSGSVSQLDVYPPDVTKVYRVELDFVYVSGTSYTVTLTAYSIDGVYTDTDTVTYTPSSEGINLGYKSDISGQYFGGAIWQADFNGIIVPINEGSGTVIHDSEENIVGTLTTSNESAFWAGRRVNEALLAQDSLEGPFFFDSARNDIPRSQPEIEAYVATGKDATFFCSEKGLSMYTDLLTGEDLFDALERCGQAEAVTVGGAPVTVSGETIYIRN